jgi:hypothetical protein
MLSSPTSDQGKLLSVLHNLVPYGANHFVDGLKVAMVRGCGGGCVACGSVASPPVDATAT